MNVLEFKRKYLTSQERELFRQTADKKEIAVKLFCHALYQTGGRISECLAMTPDNFDPDGQYIYLESLKKRITGNYRRLPVNPQTIQIIKSYCTQNNIHSGERIWNWSRMTAYRHVKAVMLEAGISKYQAFPKALRHSFAVSALEAGVPMNLIQRWLGHADWKTTAIYAELMGDEEKFYARRLWENQKTMRQRPAQYQQKPGILLPKPEISLLASTV